MSASEAITYAGRPYFTNVPDGGTPSTEPIAIFCDRPDDVPLFIDARWPGKAFGAGFFSEADNDRLCGLCGIRVNQHAWRVDEQRGSLPPRSIACSERPEAVHA